MAQSAASSSGRKKRGTPKSRAKRAAEEEEEEEEGEQGGDEDSFMMEMDQQLGLEEPKKGTVREFFLSKIKFLILEKYAILDPFLASFF